VFLPGPQSLAADDGFRSASLSINDGTVIPSVVDLRLNSSMGESSLFVSEPSDFPYLKLVFPDHGRRHSIARRGRVSTSMIRRNKYKNRIELLQGTLDMLILQTLQWGPQHGYGLVQAIRLQSGDVLQIETGSLYPALHRLERQGWVSAAWRQTESNQRAKYYRITAAGKKQLASDLDKWQQISAAIGSILQSGPERGDV